MAIVAKAAPPKLLSSLAAQQEARARGLASQLAAFFERLRAELLARLKREGPTKFVLGLSDKSVAKAAKAPKTKEETARLIAAWGLAQAQDASASARKIATGELRLGAIEARGPVPLSEFRDLATTADRRAADILARQQADVTAQIQRALRDALSTDPAPSTAEIARQLQAAVRDLPALSYERAMLIARTEQGIAQNAGIIAGYEATGVRRIKWLAFKSPVWPRRHDKMSGVERDLDGPPFTLPDGTDMRWPQDLFGPAKHTINCRCSSAPVRAPKPKPAQPPAAAPARPTAPRPAPPAPLRVPNVPADAPPWMRGEVRRLTDDDVVEGWEYQGKIASLATDAQLGTVSSNGLTDDEKKVLHAITLWTAGNVSSVRDPAQYSAGLAKKPIQGIQFSDGPTLAATKKEDYEAAHEVMRRLAAVPFSGPKRPIYRGLNLPRSVIDKLKPGQLFALGSVTSFSDNRDAAEDFTGDDAALFIIEKPTKGTDVRALSVYPEAEIVVGGYVRIQRVEIDPNGLPLIYLESE